MNNFPPSVRIGPFEYKIEVNEQEAHEYDHYGRTHYRGRRITLDDRIPETEIRVVVLHEILHALGEAYEIPYWTQHENVNEKPVDKIDLMAKALLVFLKSNPDVARWLGENAATQP